ncbi:MAG: hypothetical protein V4594_12210 [Bacteroidota bacterium]
MDGAAFMLISSPSTWKVMHWSLISMNPVTFMDWMKSGGQVYSPFSSCISPKGTISTSQLLSKMRLYMTLVAENLPEANKVLISSA